MPNRIIKESLCTSEKIASLSDFEFRLWIGLITQVDDAGRGDARPAVIKGRVFPFRERLSIKDIDAALQELAAKGCVSLYEVDGKPYFWFPGWAKHQRVRDCKPKYPAPGENDNSPPDGGFPPPSAADCGELPQNAAIIQSNPNPIQIQSESVDRAGARGNPAVAAVWSDYMNRVNPSCSRNTLDELAGYAEELGEAVCKRAFDIALDNKKTTWSYIRAILRDKLQKGVKCLADWDALEKQREDEKSGKKGGGENDISWMRQFLPNGES